MSGVKPKDIGWTAKNIAELSNALVAQKPENVRAKHEQAGEKFLLALETLYRMNVGSEWRGQFLKVWWQEIEKNDTSVTPTPMVKVLEAIIATTYQTEYSPEQAAAFYKTFCAAYEKALGAFTLKQPEQVQQQQDVAQQLSSARNPYAMHPVPPASEASSPASVDSRNVVEASELPKTTDVAEIGELPETTDVVKTVTFS